MKVQQRRGPGPPHQAQPSLRTSLSSPSVSSSFRGRFTGGTSLRRKVGGQHGSGSFVCKALIIILVAATALLVSLRILFPSQVLEVEKEAEVAGHNLAQKALDMEQGVQDWWGNHRQQQPQPPTSEDGENGNGDVAATRDEQQRGGGRPTGADRSVPNAATARMEAQSSRWVDGEKALKKQLQVLYDMQQRGENLGVPVLTRFLGDDFPAWVEPGMDEAEWKRRVDAKYAEMRAEEELWKKEMQKLIEQRERDIGITTP
jgi:hypothetical protein